MPPPLNDDQDGSLISRLLPTITDGPRDNTVSQTRNSPSTMYLDSSEVALKVLKVAYLFFFATDSNPNI